MKRFHIHIAVKHLETSIAFYTNLFGQSPAKLKDDYAKWILEQPAVNFAISRRGHAAGVNHLGFEVDTQEELENLRLLAESASEDNIISQGETSCCYARSEKHWTIDPQGLAWEHFMTTSDSEVFGTDNAAEYNTCCIPLAATQQDDDNSSAACCIPEADPEQSASCCR